jgi:dTDP-glucose 4,6-dehydratase
MEETVIVTGGAGFIGSNFVLHWMKTLGTKIVNVDLLTYAGNLNNLSLLNGNTKHIFVRGNIGDRGLFNRLLAEHRPRAIINFAAESHVDRSINGPEAFINTNILGTYHLLECSKNYWLTLSEDDRSKFRFLHISTDEVYGSLDQNAPSFTESHGYYPNSPYAASKAASDHLVRAWCHTYGFPAITTNCSNNYGPYQFPEKLIPLTITKALSRDQIPIYGDGKNIRDWLYVEDHCDAILKILESGKVGEVYNIGGCNEKSNIDVVNTICETLDAILPQKSINRKDLISFVRDRPGHDKRYAIDSSKIMQELGWKPNHNFDVGLSKTVEWYIKNTEWLNAIKAK